MHDPVAELGAQVATLQAENSALRQELERLHQQAHRAADNRQALLSGGARLLVPLLDRQHVARSFGRLAMTISRFSGLQEQWPTRDEILAETRTFVESGVRFVIRRRAIITLFSLLATAIPVIQIYLVIQQNEIIQNQTRFSEMQVYDVVSRSMVSGNRNARLMTSALLARSDLDFLRGVVDEAFARDMGVIAGRDGVDARSRRLEDAAFRGHLIRAVISATEQRLGSEAPSLVHEVTAPMFARIVEDAADRLPVVIRLGESVDGVGEELREQVDHYVLQVWAALRLYVRLARAQGEDAEFATVAGPLLTRASAVSPKGSAFGDAYRFGLQDFVVDVGANPELTAAVTPADSGTEGAGIQWLRERVEDAEVDWDAVQAQLAGTP